MAAEEEKRARARAAVTSTGIGAGFERTIGPPGRDGQRFCFRVSDGVAVGSIEAEIAASEPIAAAQIPVLTLQRAVERLAGRFPAESRLRDLLQEGCLQLRCEDFRDGDFDPATSPLAA